MYTLHMIRDDLQGWSAVAVNFCVCCGAIPGEFEAIIGVFMTGD